MLLAASSDGYISVIFFHSRDEKDEANIFGERLPIVEVPEKLRPQYEVNEQV